MRDIETRAWNCDEWPEELATLVEDMCERADQIGDGMSTEQLVAYAVLVERERCAAVAEMDMRSDLAKKIGYDPEWHRHGVFIASAIRAGR